MIHVAENGRGLFTSSVRALGCAALLLLHLDPGSCRAPIGCAQMRLVCRSSLQIWQCQAGAEGWFVFAAALVWHVRRWTQYSIL
jgi:hypothetical protein